MEKTAVGGLGSYPWPGRGPSEAPEPAPVPSPVMLTVEEALEKIASAAGAPRAHVEEVPLPEALDRVLAEDVRMDHDVPPFRRAAMDGFALVPGDASVGRTLRVTGRIAAGDAAEPLLRSGETVRIMTGAPVPPDAERVVPVEWTALEGDVVRIERLPSDASHVVPRGDHVRAGEVVLRSGTRVGPGALGVLASAGRARVAVAARPHVAVLGTGSELVDPAAVPGPGQIRNSNGVTLAAQVLRAGGAVQDLGVARDEEDPLRAAVRRGLGADLLLLSGGVSRGELDLVPHVLEAEGVTCVFHRWAVQPGGPLWFGVRGDTLVFGLPGNPAASFFGFELLAVPALRARMG
ncbi:MAG: molybdopterin molybdotransferase MoeA, partial [Planctomycetota bacterium]